MQFSAELFMPDDELEPAGSEFHRLDMINVGGKLFTREIWRNDRPVQGCLRTQTASQKVFLGHTTDFVAEFPAWRCTRCRKLFIASERAQLEHMCFAKVKPQSEYTKEDEVLACPYQYSTAPKVELRVEAWYGAVRISEPGCIDYYNKDQLLYEIYACRPDGSAVAMTDSSVAAGLRWAAGPMGWEYWYQPTAGITEFWAK